MITNKIYYWWHVARCECGKASKPPRHKSFHLIRHRYLTCLICLDCQTTFASVFQKRLPATKHNSVTIPMINKGKDDGTLKGVGVLPPKTFCLDCDTEKRDRWYKKDGVWYEEKF